ncbi:MAG TPA: GDP-mannose 4,6-dehydratase [Steroidobacteraceae bacterium]|nr:GDP-mannose 4,6-dehydratase [Steroidobacteraceae bacterium]
MTAAADIDPQFWSGRRVLLTGHTGFKGAWLALWLQSLGARVTGLAPGPPTDPSLYALARVGEAMAQELEIDVRDGPAVREALRATRPEIVLHLAAQPMVRLSLREPALTYAVNVMGTVNVLEAVRSGESVRSVVVVTSDKCYANPSAYGATDDAGGVRGYVGGVRGDAGGVGGYVGGVRGDAGVMRGDAGGVLRFRESDPLGGHDPYSSSKACAELVVAAYRQSYFSAGDGPQVASARAGNVIGGGDFGEDRLVPDVLRAHARRRPVRVRNPDAIRPWQHVLNPLSGYLTLAGRLCESGGDGEPGGDGYARAFNFGPRAQDAWPVRELVRRLHDLLDEPLPDEHDYAANPPEAMRLELDSGAAERELGWRPRWDLDEALARVAAWQEAYARGEDMRGVSTAQIAAFVCSK